MSFHSQSDFNVLCGKLSGTLVASAAQFLSSRDISLRREALNQMSTGIDAVAGEILMFGGDIWPDSAKPDITHIPCEVAPSETDPPRPCDLVCTTLTIALALAVGALLHTLIGVGDYFSIGFGILTVALFFGSTYATVAGSFASALHNFFVVPPVLTFTWPTEVEVTMSAWILLVAIATPWIARRALDYRSRAFAAS